MPFCCQHILQYNNGDDDSLLIFVRWTYETGVVLSLDEQLVRSHCWVCSNLKVLLVFDTVRDCNATLIIYTYYYGNDGSVLIFVCWMHGPDVVLVLNQQLVRLYCCVCLNLKVLVISVWCIVIQGNVTLMHALFCCPNTLRTMAMTALRWSSFVECMEWVLRWPCANSACVFISFCVWS